MTVINLKIDCYKMNNGVVGKPEVAYGEINGHHIV